MCYYTKGDALGIIYYALSALFVFQYSFKHLNPNVQHIQPVLGCRKYEAATGFTRGYSHLCLSGNVISFRTPDVEMVLKITLTGYMETSWVIPIRHRIISRKERKEPEIRTRAKAAKFTIAAPILI